MSMQNICFHGEMRKILTSSGLKKNKRTVPRTMLKVSVSLSSIMFYIPFLNFIYNLFTITYLRLIMLDKIFSRQHVK